MRRMARGALLMAIEPQTARRVAQGDDRRTKQEYALFMKELAARYPAAAADEGGAGQPQHALDEFLL